MQKPVYSSEDEQLLMSYIWSPQIADNPEAFVLYAFPWGQANTPLEKFSGPRHWQRKVLRRITEHIRDNKGQLDPSALREAVASGRGIGKSALVSWLIMWMLSTRIGSTVIVSANSENQLRSVTWGELTKWCIMAINSHWWEPSATKLVPAAWLTTLVERDLKKGTRYWAAEGKLWSEENPDSYAGVHNHDGMMVIFDEASGIPDGIWSVASGFFTESIADRYWLAFSNPRRNSGYFYDCFHEKSDYWGTTQIDARTVEDVDKMIYEQIIAEYGEDSYEARVEVYGDFPSMGDDQYISVSSVELASQRPRYNDFNDPVIMGIDPGKGNPDPCSIAIRRGRDITDLFDIFEDDPVQLLDKLINKIEQFNPEYIIVDEGGLGWGIVGHLKKLKYRVTPINSAWTSKNPIVFGNKRAEIWGATKAFIKYGSIPNDKKLKKDFVSPKRLSNGKGALMIESKKEVLNRLTKPMQ
jgi:hypothetical protein